MKPHIKIALNDRLSDGKIPYWEDFIHDKSLIVERFNNNLDRIFERYNIRIWITKEYRSELGGFSNTAIETETGLDSVYRIIFQEDSIIPAGLTEDIRQMRIVRYAEEIEVGVASIPVTTQSALPRKYDDARASIYLPRAHLLTRGHPQIKVAILDTGLSGSHPEFEGMAIQKTDFVNLDGLDTSEFVGDVLGYDNIPEDEVGHGTHVAGIIAAQGRRMPPGIVPECSLMVVRVLATMEKDGQRFGAGLIDNINTGIKWAVDNGADVINMSLGVRHEHGGLPHQEIVNYALKKGVSIVAASGNDGTNDKYYPGALPGVIAVAAVDAANRTSAFSSFGSHVSFSAPGSDIFSAFAENGYALASGTSQAAPFVSGGVAMLKSLALKKGRRLTDTQVKQILIHTCDRPGAQFKTEKDGFGRINLIDALKMLNSRL